MAAPAEEEVPELPDHVQHGLDEGPEQLQRLHEDPAAQPLRKVYCRAAVHLRRVRRRIVRAVPAGPEEALLLDRNALCERELLLHPPQRRVPADHEAPRPPVRQLHEELHHPCRALVPRHRLRNDGPCSAALVLTRAE